MIQPKPYALLVFGKKACALRCYDHLHAAEDDRRQWQQCYRGRADAAAAVYQHIDISREVDLIVALRQFSTHAPDPLTLSFIEAAIDMVCDHLAPYDPRIPQHKPPASNDERLLRLLRVMIGEISDRRTRVHLSCALQDIEDRQHLQDGAL